jgi:sensor histidine kinase YesM
MGRLIYIYSSLFISLALNIPKLIALRDNSTFARYAPFNLYELLFQTVLNFLFCLCLFLAAGKLKKEVLALMAGIVLMFIFTYAGIAIQRRFFGTGYFLPGKGLGVKFMLTLVLVFIELRILAILRQSRMKEIENGRLRNAYLKAELDLLKGQLQPHFFFNALSSLSGVVREDPVKAQYYINQLSKFFRYSLQKEENGLVTVQEEINAVNAYAALLQMRYEDGFQLTMNVPEEYYQRRLPHMSLQPLVENAVKHNAQPLLLEITANHDELVVKNRLQPVRFPEPGTGIGLANLGERYKILLHQEITIEKTSDEFIVKIPLQ